MQFKIKMTFKARNIILILIFFNFFIAFSQNELFQNAKPKVINSKKYISINNLQKFIPNSSIKNKYTLEFDNYKIKVYPSSFYLLLESKNSTVFQFNYPVIMIDNELFLPFEQTINIINDIYLGKKSQKEFVKSKQNLEIKKTEKQVEKKQIAKEKPEQKKSLIRMNNEEIPLETPKFDSEKKSKNKDYFDESLEEIAPIINETFDYLLLDGSEEIRQYLKQKKDSTNESFSPDSYRIPKNLKRKLK